VEREGKRNEMMKMKMKRIDVELIGEDEGGYYGEGVGVVKCLLFSMTW
jgi:hypothetical protein